MTEGRRRRCHRVTPLTRPSGAAARVMIEWGQIDWLQHEKNVTRLQARIVKAEKEGRRGKVKSLQRLLTHSFSGKVLAVRRVTTNRGKRTPGVDGETWTTPAQKEKAVHQLGQHGYRPQPLRRVYIDKPGTTKKRPLGIPTMKDRAMQALYLLALSPVAETTGDENSYGYRPERSTADAIAQCFILLARSGSAQWILEGDIKSCFDRISHDWLLEHARMARTILGKWLKAGFMHKSIFNPTEEGTPQGGIASPVLANMALDGLEATLRERYPKRGHQAEHKVNLVRFADDFIICADSKEVLVNEVRPLVERFLGERGLELSPEKTVVTHIEQGFDFLGQSVRKYDGKLLIKPSKRSVRSFLRNVRRVIRESHGMPAGILVIRLNRMIRGWANHHRHVVSSSTFSYVDSEIWKALWRWALREHRNKGRRWIAKKYFLHDHGRQWLFTADVDTAEGKKKQQIFLAASVPIRRHIKVRSQANPFDPEWTDYFEARHKRPRTRPPSPNDAIPAQGFLSHSTRKRFSSPSP
jgi:RNA-directed DNA polymerase